MKEDTWKIQTLKSWILLLAQKILFGETSERNITYNSTLQFALTQDKTITSTQAVVSFIILTNSKIAEFTLVKN